MARVFCVTRPTHRNSRACKTADRPRYHLPSPRRDGRARIFECGSRHHVGAARGRGSGSSSGMQEQSSGFQRCYPKEAAPFALQALTGKASGISRFSQDAPPEPVPACMTPKPCLRLRGRGSLGEGVDKRECGRASSGTAAFLSVVERPGSGEAQSWVLFAATVASV